MAAFSRNFRPCARLRQILPAPGKTVRHNNMRHAGAAKIEDKDLQLFLREDVQKLLKRMTEVDSDVVFGERISDLSRRPAYKLLSDNELKVELKHAHEMMEQHLQMPPFMKERQNRNQVLAENPEIAPVLTSKYVFVDISETKKELDETNEAIVVCRHPDGTLKWADWSVVDRVLQIYKPKSGRQVIVPRMFEQDQLEKILTPDNYVYILEAACTQFEPDSGDFLRVTRRVYEHIFANNAFYTLRATRFYGPMAFYLAKMNKIEPLLVFLIENKRISSAIDLINLKMIMTGSPQITGSNMAIISSYVKKANQDYKSQLMDAIKKYLAESAKSK